MDLIFTLIRGAQLCSYMVTLERESARILYITQRIPKIYDSDVLAIIQSRVYPVSKIVFLRNWWHILYHNVSLRWYLLASHNTITLITFTSIFFRFFSVSIWYGITKMIRYWILEKYAYVCRTLYHSCGNNAWCVLTR